MYTSAIETHCSYFYAVVLVCVMFLKYYTESHARSTHILCMRMQLLFAKLSKMEEGIFQVPVSLDGLSSEPPHNPVFCRGIKLLGVVANGVTFVCVHQLAVELWKSYDTPRAAVQKKIEKLNITLGAFNRKQILLLRKHGIIDNFRATSLKFPEAEMLFDALEYSRRSRGLIKHKLKSAASDRNLRKEEIKIKKKQLKRKLITKRAKAAGAGTTDVCVNTKGALNRDASLDIDGAGASLPSGSSEGVSKDLDLEPSSAIDAGTLLVAEDSFELPGFKEWEFSLELVPNLISPNVQPSRDPSVLQRMDANFDSQILIKESVTEPQGVVEDHLHVKQFMQCLPTTSSSNRVPDSSGLCPRSLNFHISRIRSPSCGSSDFDEQISHHSCGTSSRSRSGTATPNKSSPEQFLHIDSEESDCEGTAATSIHNNSNQNTRSTTPVSQHCQYRGIPHKGKQLREVGGGISSPRDPETKRRNSSGNSSSFEEGGTTESTSLQILGPKHRIVKATKLRHYAKTTSPSSHTSSTPSSLLVSISLSSLPAGSSTAPTTNSSNKPRKPTALSHFATKKRALSRSPSVSSNQDTSPISSCTPPALANGSEIGMRSKGNGRGGGKVGRPPKKCGRSGPKPSAPVQPDQDRNADVPDQDRNADVLPMETEPCVCDGSTNGKVLADASLVGQGLRHNPSGVEDDEMSVASSNTTSSSGNSGAAGNTTTRSQQRGGGKKGSKLSQSSILRMDTNFSLRSLFSYYPPTLTIRDGELVPEKSLSIKNLNRSSLPPSHPIDRWSLGQPVRGRWSGSMSGQKSKKPRKNSTQSSKA